VYQKMFINGEKIVNSNIFVKCNIIIRYEIINSNLGRD